MNYLKYFFIFQSMILFPTLFGANDDFNPEDFIEKIWLSESPCQPKPEIRFHLYSKSLSLGLLTLQDLADFLPQGWNRWSEAQQEKVLASIKQICERITYKSRQQRDFGNPSRILNPNFYSSYLEQGKTDPNRIIMLKYFDFISTLDERKIQAILRDGINLSNPEFLNFIDLKTIYPNIENRLLEEVKLSIPITIEIQSTILEALKEKEKEFLAMASLIKERKQNTKIATELTRLLS